MELELAGPSTFKNLNIRIERHGNEDKALGLDLRLVLRGDSDDLVHFGPALKSLLYTEQGALRLPYVEPLHLTCKFEDHKLTIGNIEYDGVTCAKFAITPEPDNRVELGFSCSISDADPACLPALCGLLIEEVVPIHIEPMQADLFSKAEKAEAAA